MEETKQVFEVFTAWRRRKMVVAKDGIIVLSANFDPVSPRRKLSSCGRAIEVSLNLVK